MLHCQIIIICGSDKSRYERINSTQMSIVWLEKWKTPQETDERNTWRCSKRLSEKFGRATAVLPMVLGP